MTKVSVEEGFPSVDEKFQHFLGKLAESVKPVTGKKAYISVRSGDGIIRDEYLFYKSFWSLGEHIVGIGSYGYGKDEILEIYVRNEPIFKEIKKACKDYEEEFGIKGTGFDKVKIIKRFPSRDGS